MAHSDERICPFCLETVPYRATRCKHCGSVLPASRKKRSSFVAFVLFLTSVTLGVFCIYLSEELNQERRQIDALERKIEKLDSTLISVYDLDGEWDSEDDSSELSAE